MKNLEELQVVIEDLEHLQEDWGPGVTDPEVRRGSAVLRRLLVEDAYGRAWRGSGFEKEPKVIAINIDSQVGHVNRSDVTMAIAGGALVGGLQYAGACFLRQAKDKESPPPSKPITEEGYPGEQEFTLAGYLGSTAAIAGGRIATRRDIIKYYANAKGGVHLGAGTKKKERKLVRRMEKFERKITFSGINLGQDGPLARDGLLLELVCIAQAIGRAPDTARFLAHARQLLSTSSS